MRLRTVGFVVVLVGTLLVPASAGASHSSSDKLVYSNGSGIFVCPFPRGDALCLGIDFGATLNVHPTLSPDAERVAWARDGRIQVAPSSGGDSDELTDTGRDLWPVWSPDGQWIYFHRFRQDFVNVDVYRVPANGSGPATPFAAHDQKIQGLPAVAANGDVAAYTTNLDGSNGRVEIFNPAGNLVKTTGPVPPGEINALVPGSWILTVTDTSTGERRVYHLDDPTNSWVPFEGAAAPGGCSLVRSLGESHLCVVEEPAASPGVFVCTHAGCDAEPEIPGDTKGVDVHAGEVGGGSRPTYDLSVASNRSIVYPRLGREVVWFHLLPSKKDFRVETDPRALGMTIFSAEDSQRESLPTTVSVRTNAPLRSGHAWLVPGPKDCAFTVLGGAEAFCDLAPLAIGDWVTAGAEWEWRWDETIPARRASRLHGSTYQWRWNVICRPPLERECDNNVLSGRIGFALPGESRAQRVGTRQVSGAAIGAQVPSARSRGSSARSAERARQANVKRADRPARVHVAIVKLAKGQRGFKGTPRAFPEDARGAKGRCSWLANRKGNFRRNRAGVRNVCDNPIWVRAKLAKGKRAKANAWKLRWRKRLGPGRYVLYTRTTTRRGISELRFTKGQRNRVEFRVRKRR